MRIVAFDQIRTDKLARCAAVSGQIRGPEE